MIEAYLGLEPVFARHETFHPRFGWLRKGVRATDADPDVFAAEDAPTRLGVGKNMVRAIRYWGKAFDTLREADASGRTRIARVTPSNLGVTLFASEDGWDPYLEDPATLWLLHWRLLRPPCFAPVWSLAFNKFGAIEFSEDDLFAFVADTSGREWPGVAESSLRKDVACLLRMYARRPKTRESIEDELDCPFRDLNLIEPTPDGTAYRFVTGSKPSLPDDIVISATLDFLSFSASTARTASIARLASAPGGPGRAFKLTEAALAEAVERYCLRRDALVRLSNPGGVAQLAFDGNAASASLDVLETFYAERTGSGRRIGGGAEDRELETLDQRLPAIASALDRLEAVSRRGRLIAEGAGRG